MTLVERRDKLLAQMNFLQGQLQLVLELIQEQEAKPAEAPPTNGAAEVSTT